VLAIDLEIEQLDWESICYKDGDVGGLSLELYRRPVLAAEKLILVVDMDLFSSEGHSGSPDFDD
jgi:hypothetical protein